MPKSPNTVDRQIQLFIHPDLLKELDMVAKEVGLSRHRLMLNLFRVGLDDYYLAKRLGIASVVKWFRDGKSVDDLSVLARFEVEVIKKS